MSKLILEDGSEIINANRIQDEIFKYFKGLYSSKEHDLDKLGNLLSGVEPPVLSQEIKQAMNLPLEMKEFSEALQQMPNNKCPGRSGLTTEFYKVFWAKLKKPYFEAIKYAIKQKKLHSSALQGIITLIPKKDKDKRYLRNTRPITLNNVDYKIYSKALGNRLKEVMPQIIDEDQTGFMAGRDISLNLRKTIDIMQFADKNNLQALIMSVDYAKAFDTLEWDVLWKAMEFFNFGDTFIDYVKLLFEGSFCCVLNNGHFTQNIHPTRATKQGCSSSAFLFNIYAQLASLCIKQNSLIKGIQINNVEYKLAQFADDLNLFLMYDKVSLFETVRLFDSFENTMGLVVNYNKTNIYRIGSLKNSNAKLYTGKPFVWTNDPIKILGVTIASDIDEMQNLNLEAALEKMWNVCSIWFDRQLSLSGRVILVNNLMASLFVHKLTVLSTIQLKHIKKYEHILRRFLWQDKRPKIALNVLYRSKTDGGLALVNLAKKDAALKVQWINKIKTFSQIANLASSYLPPDIWTSFLVPKDIYKMNIASEFWRDVLVAWMRYRFEKWNWKIPKNELVELSINNNSLIKVGGKVLSSRDCQRVEMSKVEDLLSNENRDKLKNADEIVALCQGDAIKQMKINSIISSLSTNWASCPDVDYNITQYSNYTYQTLPRKVTRIVYNDFNATSDIHRLLADKWSAKLGSTITTQEIQHAFICLPKLAKSIKLRDFQFRFLHQKIFTNKMLYRWGLVDSERCYYCRDHYETIFHLFFECLVVKRFWTRVWTWYEAMTDNEIEITNKFILLNMYNQKVQILDILILIAKQHIFKCKCLQRDLNFYNYKDEVLLICKIERRIAFKTGKIKPFQKLWGLFLK